jgi:hypothetical protein
MLGQRGGKALVFYNYDTCTRDEANGSNVVWTRNEFGEDIAPVNNPAGQPQNATDTYIFANLNAGGYTLPGPHLWTSNFEIYTVGPAHPTSITGSGTIVNDTTADFWTGCCGGSGVTYAIRMYKSGQTDQCREMIASSPVAAQAVTVTSAFTGVDTSWYYVGQYDAFCEIKKNRDVFNQMPGTFDGTGGDTVGGGVGCGTYAQMMAITPIVTGVGYWATNQSCSSIISLTGASSLAVMGGTRTASSKIEGTLYRWNGSSWVVWFTPATYPHPLRGEGTVVSYVPWRH